MSYVCGKSWRLPADMHYHHFCTAERGHGGRCCNWVTGEMPPDAIPYEADATLHAELAKQRANQAKADARKTEQL